MFCKTEIRTGEKIFAAEGHTPFRSFMRMKKAADGNIEKSRYTVLILTLDGCEIFRAHGMSAKSAFDSFRHKLNEL